jgi:hypothetical protein
MAQTQIPTSIQKIINVSAILVVIFLVNTLVFGFLSNAENTELKHHQNFLEATQDINQKYEQQLSIYNQEAKESVDTLMSVRPEEEKDYVEFIRQIEGISAKLELNLQLRSVGQPKDGEAQNSFLYSVHFAGSLGDLRNFLIELETLPYYLKITNLEFQDLRYMDDEQREQDPQNVILTIQLFTKNSS